MIYLLIILCLFFLCAGLYCSKNNIFAPPVITAAVWFCCLAGFVMLDHKLPPLSATFFTAASLWITGVCLSSLTFQAPKYRDNKLNDPGQLIMNIYLFFAIATIPSLLMFAKTALLYGTSGNWALDLRLAALGRGSGFTETFSGLQVLIWQVSLLLELLCYNRKRWWRLALISGIYLTFGAVTMSKIVFLNFFFYTCSILYFKKIIKLRQILSGIAVLFVLFMGIQSVRHAVKFSNAGDNFFEIYLLGNLSAFDTLVPCNTAHWGENTFRIFYALSYKCGFSDIEPVNPILKWITYPIRTNTYTGMYPFYTDFGMWGVGIFSILFGAFFGWMFKKAQMGNNFHILLYAVFINVIFMQYAAELFLTNFAAYLKIIILLSLPFLATKHGLLSIRKRFTH